MHRLSDLVGLAIVQRYFFGANPADMGMGRIRCQEPPPSEPKSSVAQETDAQLGTAERCVLTGEVYHCVRYRTNTCNRLYKLRGVVWFIERVMLTQNCADTRNTLGARLALFYFLRDHTDENASQTRFVLLFSESN